MLQYAGRVASGLLGKRKREDVPHQSASERSTYFSQDGSERATQRQKENGRVSQMFDKAEKKSAAFRQDLSEISPPPSKRKVAPFETHNGTPRHGHHPNERKTRGKPGGGNFRPVNTLNNPQPGYIARKPAYRKQHRTSEDNSDNLAKSPPITKGAASSQSANNTHAFQAAYAQHAWSQASQNKGRRTSRHSQDAESSHPCHQGLSPRPAPSSRPSRWFDNISGSEGQAEDTVQTIAPPPRASRRHSPSKTAHPAQAAINKRQRQLGLQSAPRSDTVHVSDAILYDDMRARAALVDGLEDITEETVRKRQASKRAQTPDLGALGRLRSRYPGMSQSLRQDDTSEDELAGCTTVKSKPRHGAIQSSIARPPVSDRSTTSTRVTPPMIHGYDASVSEALYVTAIQIQNEPVLQQQMTLTWVIEEALYRFSLTAGPHLKFEQPLDIKLDPRDWDRFAVIKEDLDAEGSPGLVQLLQLDSQGQIAGYFNLRFATIYDAEYCLKRFRTANRECTTVRTKQESFRQQLLKLFADPTSEQNRSAKTSREDDEQQVSQVAVAAKSKPRMRDSMRARKEADVEADSATRRSSRSTRLRGSHATKAKSTTPEPVEKWSKIHNPTPWSQPVVYPTTGVRRVTIEFSDIERLDEGEFLNDTLISFALRRLEDRVDPKYKVHFFNSYFYSTLTGGQGRKGYHYNAVRRWTKNTDVMAHEFVIVPINHDLHWFAAIICNLPRLTGAPSPMLSPVEHDVTTIEDDEPAVVAAKDVQVIDEDPAEVSARASKSAKRKGPPSRRYDTKAPTIISLDSFGSAHTTELAVLKDYITEEALDKRQIEIPKGALQGVTAKGLAEQKNFCDCGVYVIAYIAAFVLQPRRFIDKVLTRELDFAAEVPDFSPQKMRQDLRDDLFKLYEEQEAERQARLEHKLQAKANAQKVMEDKELDKGNQTIEAQQEMQLSEQPGSDAERHSSLNPAEMEQPQPHEPIAAPCSLTERVMEETLGPVEVTVQEEIQPQSELPTQTTPHDVHEGGEAEESAVKLKKMSLEESEVAAHAQALPPDDLEQEPARAYGMPAGRSSSV